MADFDSVLAPYRLHYPGYEFYNASPLDEPIEVTTKNSATDKTVSFTMPDPFHDDEMAALVAFSILQVQ